MDWLLYWIMSEAPVVQLRQCMPTSSLLITSSFQLFSWFLGHRQTATRLSTVPAAVNTNRPEETHAARTSSTWKLILLMNWCDMASYAKMTPSFVPTHTWHTALLLGHSLLAKLLAKQAVGVWERVVEWLVLLGDTQDVTSSNSGSAESDGICDYLRNMSLSYVTVWYSHMSVVSVCIN